MIVRAQRGLRSNQTPSSTMRRITSYMSYGLRGESGSTSSSSSSMRSTGSVTGWRSGGASSQFCGKNDR